MIADRQTHTHTHTHRRTETQDTLITVIRYPTGGGVMSEIVKYIHA